MARLDLTDFCRPFHLDGRLVEAAVERLRRRAIALGWTPRKTMPVRRISSTTRGSTP